MQIFRPTSDIPSSSGPIIGCILGLLLLLSVMIWDSRRELRLSDRMLPLEGPLGILQHRETFRSGVEALLQNDGSGAVIALRSFSFGDRAVEEYRLYFLANAYQLEGDTTMARRMLARLWSRDPRMLPNEDAGFNLATLYAEAGEWRRAGEVYGSLASRAEHHTVQAQARERALRARFYAGDPGGVFTIARALVIQNPATQESARAVRLLRSLRSIPDTGSLQLTLGERLGRAEHLLQDGLPERALAEVASLDPVALGSPARERLLLLRGTAFRRLSRHRESEQALESLFSSWYKYAVPAVHESAKNQQAMADAIDPDRTVTRKVRAGWRKARERGKVVSVPNYRLVTEKVEDPEAKRKRDEHGRLYLSRLDDLLQLPISDDIRADVLTRLARIGEQEEDDDRLMRSMEELVALEPSNDIGLQRMWDQGWEAYGKRNLDRAINRFDFIERVYLNPNVKRQARYWRARALEHQGKEKEARAIYTGLANAPYDDLYALFARERIEGERPRARPVPESGHRGPDWAELAEREMPRELRFAYELMLLGMSREARLEIQANGSNANRRWADAILADIFLAEEAYTIAARYMKRAFPAIGTSEQDSVPGHFIENYYPLRYEDLIREYAAERDLDPHLIMAIILQESGFDPRAESPAGARGLMQLMPGTAREIGDEIYTVFTPRRVTDPEVNINLGTFYIRKLIDMMGGDAALAVAGYNGGPYRVRRLRRESKAPRDEFIEAIPMAETRNYVKRITILRSSYQRLHGKPG
ncbi:MAG TPA: transglycosylase SLT domain-containing protein [Thermoanaerobaculia bacterium]|nr:transglycosylase SLT domain-containing protein [Thermoanaerobaculia bacterium]